MNTNECRINEVIRKVRYLGEDFMEKKRYFKRLKDKVISNRRDPNKVIKRLHGSGVGRVWINGVSFGKNLMPVQPG